MSESNGGKRRKRYRVIRLETKTRVHLERVWVTRRTNIKLILRVIIQKSCPRHPEKWASCRDNASLSRKNGVHAAKDSDHINQKNVNVCRLLNIRVVRLRRSATTAERQHYRQGSCEKLFIYFQKYTLKILVWLMSYTDPLFENPRYIGEGYILIGLRGAFVEKWNNHNFTF